MEKKCDKKLIEAVRPLREAGLSWDKITESVKVSEKSLLNYRTEGNPSYSQPFAQMVTDAAEQFDTGQTKAGQVVQSIKHTLRKICWEYRQVDVRSLTKKEKRTARITSEEKSEDRTKAEGSLPPLMPPSWMPKSYIIDYADEILDLQIEDMRLTVAEMRAECLKRVHALTVTVRVKIETEQEVDPNQAAVKNVLTNTGRKDKRWTFKDEHEIDTSDPLTQLIEQIGGVKRGLPSDSKIPDYAGKPGDVISFNDDHPTIRASNG